MHVVESRRAAREWVASRKAAGESIGLVPTMGALHRGHTSLVRIAQALTDRIALSIFVNPLQFGPVEDFQRYPRDLEADLATARAAGVDLVFAPPVSEIYPDREPWVTVVPDRGGDRLCGASRPGHFRGVLTVVAKLLGIMTPDVAIFGEKDIQQLMLIRRMVRDLEMGVEIVGGPIVREEDGLALSSRNRYLSTDERGRALTLSASLRECERLFDAGETSAERYLEVIREGVREAAVLEYAEVVDPETLEAVDHVATGSLCAIAAHVGATRLIDNTILGPSSRR